MAKRSYRKTIDKGLDGLTTLADAFAEAEGQQKKTRAKQKGQKTPTGVLFSIRNKRLGIKQGAVELKWLRIRYKKTTTGQTKWYKVAPYSYRTRRLKVGRRKMLYAYDEKDRHIKSFALRNIKNVKVTNEDFSAKWPVEIKWTDR